MNKIKDIIKKLPLARKLYTTSYNFYLSMRAPKEIFTTIYHSHQWSSVESVSGLGSDLSQTAKIIEVIPKILRQYNVQKVLDAPCGDFNWMRYVDLKGVEYIGGDIVSELINVNKSLYSSNDVHFQVLDLMSDIIPEVDLILCRDCLVHFSYRDAFRAIQNISHSGSRYLLTTTFPNRRENYDIPTGRWRPIDLECEPFNFPKPILIINEGCTEAAGKFSDKSLALWDIKTLPMSRKPSHFE